MEYSVKERLIAFLSKSGIRQADFCRAIGKSATYVASIRKSISDDVREDIARVYPELNMTWLITGKGAMYKKDDERIQCLVSHHNDINRYDNLDKAATLIEEQRKRIEEQSLEIARLEAQVAVLKEVISSRLASGPVYESPKICKSV